MLAPSPHHGVVSKLDPRLIDPRFVIGVLLVLVSAAGVYILVTATDRSATVLEAREALLPGQQVQIGDLIETSVRDDETADRYLVPDDLPAAGVIMTRTVGAGELVPVSAVGDRTGLRLTSVVVTVQGQLGASIGPGSAVDVWAAEAVDGERMPAPDVIVPGATVVRLLESESIVAGRQTTAVEILVDRDRASRLLEAIGNGDAISIVPADLPAADLPAGG